MNNQKDSAKAAIDWDHLNDVSGGDEALIQSFLNLFCDNAAVYIEELESVDLDGEEWRLVAHKLKGAAYAVGAQNVGILASDAEMASAPSADVRVVMTKELREALADVSKFLK